MSVVAESVRAGGAVAGRRGSAERAAPIVAGVLLAIPTLAAHYAPMSDLPIHEGQVGILRHFGDPEYFPPGLYELNLGHPNQLFYLLAWAVSFATGTRWAVKLVIAATQIGVLWSGARLADYRGRSRWGAVLLAPLALGYTYYWGLVANLVGFVALFATLPAIDRACATPSRAGVVRILGAFALLYLAHETVLWIAIGYVALMGIARAGKAKDRWETPLRFVPVVLTAVALLVYHIVTRRSFTQVQLKVANAFTPLGERIANVPNDLFGSYDPPVRLALFLLALVSAGTLAAARWRSAEPMPARSSGGPLGRLLGLIVHYRFEVSALFFVIGFFTAPQKWNSATLLYSRFAGPAWALFVICAAPRSPAPVLGQLSAAAIPIAILLVSWAQFVDADASYRELDALIAEIPMKSSVAACRIEDRDYRTRVYNVNPGPARVVAERGGRASLSLVTSPIAPVRIRPEYRWEEFDIRNPGNDPVHLFPASDLTRFEWVIAQSRDETLRRAMTAAFRPDARLVDAKGEWLLLRSTHPQLPLTSPDAPPGGDRESLLERIAKTLTAIEIQRDPVEP